VPGVIVAASSILLVETDPAAGDVITDLLSRVGYSVTTVTTPDEAFRRAAENHLLILDVLGEQSTSVELCREIRATPALAAIPVLTISQTDEVEERIRFLEAGADDVIARPFDARELEARVEALLLRFQRSRDRAPLASLDGSEPLRNRMVVCFSPKGGVGTTTIAVNLATATALHNPDRTLLVDLDLQWGQVATHLNLEPRHTIADLARDEQAQREPELVRTYATRHESGLHVLAAPGTPELADLVLPSHVEQILKSSLETFDTVVVDGGSALDERVLVAFERSDNVVLTVIPEVAALKAVVSLLDYLNEMGSVSTKTTFVLNQLFAKELVKLGQVESSLGVRVSAELPYDAFIYLKAVNEGVPVVQGGPRTIAAERLTILAASLFGSSASAPSANHKESRGLLGGLLKRT
jgi:pilus assembly protein CpaE